MAQAVAFARAKKQDEYVKDLTAVLIAAGHEQLADLGDATRGEKEPYKSITAYIRLSRHALQAAGWLKRYVEAAEEA